MHSLFSHSNHIKKGFIEGFLVRLTPSRNPFNMIGMTKKTRHKFNFFSNRYRNKTNSKVSRYSCHLAQVFTWRYLGKFIATNLAE